ncbi:MAG: hypothetical protein GC156_15525 [Actinomycetales bacterium]|nr:hypothetical protein [Actinomycetales bacterium]
MTEAPESAAVMAFIRERQPEVLAEAVRQLSGCSLQQLPEVAHAVSGNVGSYQLPEAHAAVMELRRVLGDPASTAADVEAARSLTLSVLRASESGSTHE